MRLIVCFLSMAFFWNVVAVQAFAVGFEPGPCAADVAKLCPGVTPGMGAVMQCLRGKVDQVSADCRKHVDSKKQMKVEEKRAQRDAQREAGRQACSSDITKFCATLPVGQGGHFKCLKDNLAQLSAECRTHIETAKRPWK